MSTSPANAIIFKNEHSTGWPGALSGAVSDVYMRSRPAKPADTECRRSCAEPRTTSHSFPEKDTGGTSQRKTYHLFGLHYYSLESAVTDKAVVTASKQDKIQGKGSRFRGLRGGRGGRQRAQFQLRAQRFQSAGNCRLQTSAKDRLSMFHSIDR